jgi:hypothetical protein
VWHSEPRFLLSKVHFHKSESVRSRRRRAVGGSIAKRQSPFSHFFNGTREKLTICHTTCQHHSAADGATKGSSGGDDLHLSEGQSSWDRYLWPDGFAGISNKGVFGVLPPWVDANVGASSIQSQLFLSQLWCSGATYVHDSNVVDRIEWPRYIVCGFV